MTTTYCNELIGTTIPATYTTPTNHAYGVGGRTFDIVAAFEVGPGMAKAGWTHMLAMLPRGGKVERYAAVRIEAGAITMAQKPLTLAGSA
jgi:hypothetical protein